MTRDDPALTAADEEHGINFERRYYALMAALNEMWHAVPPHERLLGNFYRVRRLYMAYDGDALSVKEFWANVKDMAIKADMK